MRNLKWLLKGLKKSIFKIDGSKKILKKNKDAHNRIFLALAVEDS